MLNKLIIALVFLGLAVALFNPLKGWGEAAYGPGFGDLINGGVALGMLIAAGVIAVVAGRRRRQTGGQQ